jgi:polyhydroxybutyrate depolymerase
VVVLPGSQPVGGILVVLHGYGSDGAGHQSFFPVSPASGLVTVVPSGRLDKTGRRYWAANEVCCSFDAPLDDVDVTYVLALLDAAEARWSLPRGQARLAGHSNGAALAVRLACEHPERFSKVVAFAGPVDAVPEACAASKFAGVRERTGPSPIGPAVSRDAAASKFAGVRERTGPSIVIAHGRNDRVVPYAGGSLPPTIHPNARGAVALGAEALVASLRGGGCSTVGRDLAPLNVDGARPDLETTRRVFLRDCDASSDEKHTVIELWSMDRVGHAPYAPTEAWRAALEEFFLR